LRLALKLEPDERAINQQLSGDCAVTKRQQITDKAPTNRV
jgi:hypothetical protein